MLSPGRVHGPAHGPVHVLSQQLHSGEMATAVFGSVEHVPTRCALSLSDGNGTTTPWLIQLVVVACTCMFTPDLFPTLVVSICTHRYSLSTTMIAAGVLPLTCPNLGWPLLGLVDVHQESVQVEAVWQDVVTYVVSTDTQVVNADWVLPAWCQLYGLQVRVHGYVDTCTSGVPGIRQLISTA